MQTGDKIYSIEDWYKLQKLKVKNKGWRFHKERIESYEKKRIRNENNFYIELIF